MRYAHLKQIDSEHLAAEAVRLWAREPSSLAHVQNSENFIYRFRMGKRTHWYYLYYLRLTHGEHRSYEQILAELHFVLHLKRLGCCVSSPISSLKGSLVEPLVHSQTRLHACVFEAAPGARVEGDFAAWEQSLFQEWGQALGTIHALSKGFHPSGIRRLRWNEDDVLLNARNYIPVQETAAREELERVLVWLATLPENAERFGLIHGDLCCANFHYDGQRITSFDFDDSAYHWFVYDIVCALAPMAFHPHRRLYRQ